jgi:hypothetical protein
MRAFSTKKGRMSRSAGKLVGVGAGMICRRLVVRAKDVVFVKGVIEAHDGLAHVFAESGGDLTIAAAMGRDAELDELVRDLAEELGGIVGESSVGENG